MAEQYCIYLRKSRADIEDEQRGMEDSLARHERTLLSLAKSRNYNITQIYKEVVSGETISARPEMQRLLSDLGTGIYTGVLVMEVERLARGDTIDQGIVAQAFKFSNTLIITPTKTYDPNNEFDEEYFEFGLFMSRREYKTINRRLQRGRESSVHEGKWVGNKTPYGYDRIKLEKEKGFKLIPNEKEAPIAKMIFDMYVNGVTDTNGHIERMGVSKICRRLNDMNIPARNGGIWVPATLRGMLRNPAYIGKVRWNNRPTIKKIVDGQIIKERPRNNNGACLLVDGLHAPLITLDVFNKAQEIISQNPSRPIGEKDVVRNPLSGIVVCAKCGRKMIRRPKGSRQPEDVIMCYNATCKNVGSYLFYVEEAIISNLKQWIEEYKIDLKSKNISPAVDMITPIKLSLEKQRKELDSLRSQNYNIYDLLEQGIYTTDVFLERSRLLSEKIENTQNSILTLEKQLVSEQKRLDEREQLIPKIEHLISVYNDLADAEEKNDMLKEVLEKVTYNKDKPGGRWGNPDNFEIVLYPKLPVSHR